MKLTESSKRVNHLAGFYSLPASNTVPNRWHPVLAKSCQKVGRQNTIVEALLNCHRQTGSFRAKVLAYELMLDLDDSNQSVIVFGQDEPLLAYGQAGALYPCKNRLSESGAAYLARRAGKLLLDQLCAYLCDHPALLEKKNKRKLRFETYTVPHIDAPAFVIHRAINCAWSLFIKRRGWSNKVDGGARNVEFTLSDDGRYHYHIHAITLGYFRHEDAVKRDWSECVEEAFNRQGLDWQTPATPDGLLVVNLKMMKTYGLIDSVRELAKYITKPSTFASLGPERLKEFVDVKRWPRSFAMLGVLRKTLTDAEKAEKIKRKLEKARRSEITRILRHRAATRFLVEKRSDGLAWLREVMEAGAAVEMRVLIPTEKAKLSPYLDTYPIKHAGGDTPETATPKSRGSPRNFWELAEQKEWSVYKKLRAIRYEAGREFAIGKLLAKYPDATVYTLAGRVVRGSHLFR